MPYENPLATHILQVLITNYFIIKDTGLQVPELETILLMKSHFVSLRDIAVLLMSK